MTEENKSADSVEKEGEKVTGGAEAAKQNTGTATPAEGGEEHMPDEAGKKERMTGYNELPEQSKVGGG